MMIAKKFRGVGAAVVLGLIPCLTGCAREILSVPPRASMVGSIRLDRTVALQHDTEMDPLTVADAQPTIDRLYWKSDSPPAEAFERVLFPIDAPGADSWGWSSVTLVAGTPIRVSAVEIYRNSHLYVGRVAAGASQNSHILLVVPIGDAALPAVEKLQAEDKAYIVEMNDSSTRPATASSGSQSHVSP